MKYNSPIRTFLRHPAVHIAALGALAFLLHFLIFGDKDTEENVITITEGDVEQIVAQYRMTFKRDPTKDELRSLIENQIREEVFYREAKRLGLDKNDVIIRRRLSQKMDFLSRDLASLVNPTDEAIAEFYEKNKEDYRIPPYVTFSHIFFDVDKHGVLEARDMAMELREKLNAMPEFPSQVSGFGDSFMLQSYYAEYDPRSVESQFGRQEFTDSLFIWEPGEWHGPVPSGYGLHIVFVHKRTEPRIPGFEEVREEVKEDLMDDIRKQTNDLFYAGLRSNYEIEMDDELRSALDLDTWQRTGD
jgi:hypothetical protein